MPGLTPDLEHKVETSFMQMVDDEAVVARGKLLNGPIPQDPSIRAVWARFVASLIIRNPEELGFFKQTYAEDLLAPNDYFQKRYEAAKGPDDPPTFEEWMVKHDATQPERAAIVTLTNLIANPGLIKLFRTMHWTVIDISSVSRRLMTSDRPVAFTAGMVHYQGHWALPISPTKLFLATTTVGFAEDVLKIPMGKLVRKVNEMVIGQARKYVYALDASHLAEVRRGMSKMEPPSLLRNIGRLRVSRNYVGGKPSNFQIWG
jgi:hypothetical protein